jgi:hypothetical protein
VPKQDVERKHVGRSEAGNSGAGSDGVEGSFLNRVKDVPSRPSEPHQPHPRAGEVGDLLDSDPALRDPEWLPEGVFPEIDELREEHRARLDDIKAAGVKRSELLAQYEAEEEARNAALYAGEAVPAVTSASDRQDALAAAEAERVAAHRHFQDFFDRAVETFNRMAPFWQLRFAEARANRATAVEQAEAALRQAEREAANIDQAEQWVNRTVKPLGGRYMQAPTFGVGFMTKAERTDYLRGRRDLDAEAQAAEHAHA